MLIVDMATLYENLVANSVLELDQKVLDTMRAKNVEELKKLDDKLVFCFLLMLLILFDWRMLTFFSC